MDKKHRISIFVTPSVKERLRRVSSRRDETISAWVRSVVMNAIEQAEFERISRFEDKNE